MAHEAQLAGGLAFAVQPAVGVGARFVSLVAAGLASEVTAIGIGIVPIVLGHQALVSRPGLDQGAIHAEVLLGQPLLLIGLFEHFVEEDHHGLVFDQALTVLAEHGGHPARIVHRQANEPSKQQVVLRLLHQLPLGANAVQHLQQHGAQQLLGRDAGSSALDVVFIHTGEQLAHLAQRLVDHRADDPQRVIHRHEVVELLEGEQTFGVGVSAAHGEVVSS